MHFGVATCTQEILDIANAKVVLKLKLSNICFRPSIFGSAIQHYVSIKVLRLLLEYIKDLIN